MLAECNSSDTSQKWIWTRHNEILHVKTLKCIQHGVAYLDPSNTFYMNLGLEKCNILKAEQKWKCHGPYLEKPKTFYYNGSSPHIMRITYTKDINHSIIAKSNGEKRWRRGTNMENICSSSFGCDEFANSSSGVLVLDTKSQRKGEQKIAYLSEKGQCKVDYLQFWKHNSWKRLEFTNGIFLINNTMNRIFLKWDLEKAPSNWSNLIIKLDFKCPPVSGISTKVSARCVLIKLKHAQNPDPGYRTTASCTQPETSPTESSTSTDTRNTSLPSITANTTSKTESSSSTGTTNTSLPPPATKAKSPSSSKEKQQAESSSVVGIVVGLLAAILVISGIIIGFFYYKRKGRLDKTTSKVEMNGKEHSSGDTQNPIYSSEDKDSSLFINDAGIYQEPDENMSEASQACGLYESVDDRKSDNLETKQENKPAPSLEELKYVYVTNDDVRSATQRLPAKGNNYHISNKNPPTNKSENKETENDNEVLYHTLEDDAGPVYQTLEDE